MSRKFIWTKLGVVRMALISQNFQREIQQNSFEQNYPRGRPSITTQKHVRWGQKACEDLRRLDIVVFVVLAKYFGRIFSVTQRLHITYWARVSISRRQNVTRLRWPRHFCACPQRICLWEHCYPRKLVVGKLIEACLKVTETPTSWGSFRSS